MKQTLRKATSQFILLILVSFVSTAQSDTWTRKADFGGGIRYAGVGFSIGDKGYVGTGWGLKNNNPERKDDFWEFDPKTNSWTQKANFPGGPRIYAIGMAIGKGGYVGMGYAGEYTDKRNDFWEYNPVKNTWLKKASYKGMLRVYSVSFSVQNKGYVGTGIPNDGTIATNDFWEYDPKKDKWTRKADFAGSLRYSAAAFSIGKKGYIGGGVLDTPGLIFANDLWEYDPSKDKWLQKTDFGGEGRSLLTGFSVNNKGYMGLGSTEGRNGGTKKKDFWEYDPMYDSWTQIADYGPGATSEAIGFGIDGKGYVGLGAGKTPINPIVSRFWEYKPNVRRRSATNITIHGTANPWLAGMPSGTKSQLGDRAPANSPVLLKLPLKPGSYIEVSKVTGTTAHGTTGIPFVGPEGCLNLGPCIFDNITHKVGAEHGKSSLTAPISSLVGVFLSDKIPASPAPAMLNFSSPKSRDYYKLRPKLKQVFFIGNGKTSKGVQQKIVVPVGATRLFFGTMDGTEWNNNRGALQATVKMVRYHDRNRSKHHHRGEEDMNIGSASVLDEESAEETIRSFVVNVAPNPFHSSTRIQYEIPDDGHVTINLFDVYGRKINTLVNANQSRGIYTTDLNAAMLAKGLYIYQVEYVNKNDVHVKTGKIVLVK